MTSDIVDDPIDLVIDRIERNPALSMLPLDVRVALESTRLGNRMRTMLGATARDRQARRR